MSISWIRRGTIIGPWVAALVVMSCTSSLRPVESSPLPSSSPMSPSTVPSPRSPDLFAGLPYTMDLPDGWVGGGPESYQADRDALSTLNPGLLERIEHISPPVEDEFIGVEATGDLSMAVNTLDVPRGASTAEILDQAQAQNIEALGQVLELTQPPTARRVQLPVGESVEIRWAANMDLGTGSEERKSMGYLIIGGATLYTVVFSFTDGDRNQDIEAVIDSFRLTAR